MTLSLPAPAKLNLFLHILGRRRDGYHRLQTLFQFLEYGDSLSFSLAEGLHLSCNQEELCRPDNLVLRAAEALRQHSATQQGATIHLHKRLPAGGGVGGGSSDADTTLLGLNHLWQTGLDLDTLARIGLGLGADVPVFVYGHAAWAEGIGEMLSPVSGLPEPWMLVLTPAVQVATARIFQAPALTRDTSAITLSAFLTQGGHNDCENTVCSLYPEVRSALAWLRQFDAAAMTGTGACVFQACADQEQALRRLERAPCPGFVARARVISPLAEAMARL